MLFKKILLITLTIVTCNLCLADSASEKEAGILLDSLDMQTMMSGITEQAVEMQIKNNPTLAPYKQIMMNFMEKYIGYQSLKPALIEIYANAFTDQELKEISAFYNTPAGKKSIQKMPELFKQGSQLGAQRVQEHLPELRQMFAEENIRIKQLQAKDAKQK